MEINIDATIVSYEWPTKYKTIVKINSPLKFICKSNTCINST
jgi:Tfp pilus assembly ATPase PilU